MSRAAPAVRKTGPSNVPTYDYECQACGHRFELFQSMSAKVRRKCPECEEPKLQRLIGPGAGFLFKGDGFYITDYRSDSYKTGKKAAEDKPKPKDSSTGSTPAADPGKSDAKVTGGKGTGSPGNKSST